MSANHWIVRKKRTPSTVNEVTNNRHNWNAIDIERSISITSQKAEKEPKEAKSNYKQMAALEQKETIVETSIKKGQQLIKTIPKAANIKNYEGLLGSLEGAFEEGDENQEESKSMLLIKVYVAGQIYKKLDISNSERRHHE